MILKIRQTGLDKEKNSVQRNSRVVTDELGIYRVLCAKKAKQTLQTLSQV